ncbi:hypothetical protein [Schumannella soli]|uniref:Uncharacterized protein n=1 Tax=Schumannella soli TaxID=2590779 RepID=A0A506Y2F9_9MICO|nr:hypothetical protein [Schumannella soli]TPW76093.1 hypothetical protein FJ657_09750 [Schumannella soli]
MSQLTPDPHDPVLVVAGDIQVSSQWIFTPSGTVPLRGANIVATDYSRVEQRIPTWAIVVAIVGFFVITLFSLLFLLVKEQRVVGYVQITVQAPGFAHVCDVPVTHPGTGADLHGRVMYARQLAAALG